MRKVMTEAELKLWSELRGHRLMRLGFRRQMPISGYIVDFACPARKIIVEVDGSQHGRTGAALRDRARDRRLNLLGWTVLRFWNDDAGVCDHIATVAGLSAADATAQAPRGHAPIKGQATSAARLHGSHRS
nr:endonuclease domain-containing protein [Nitratireductor mangrovi]